MAADGSRAIARYSADMSAEQENMGDKRRIVHRTCSSHVYASLGGKRPPDCPPLHLVLFTTHVSRLGRSTGNAMVKSRSEKKGFFESRYGEGEISRSSICICRETIRKESCYELASHKQRGASLSRATAVHIVVMNASRLEFSKIGKPR